MPAYSGKTKVSQVSVTGVDGLISTPQITEPLPCTLQDNPFSHSFLILPKCPTPILGRDLLSKFKASVTIPSPPSDLAYLLLLNPTSSSPAPVPSSSKNPTVWDTDNPSVASHHAPIPIYLKVKSLSSVWLFATLSDSSVHGILQARIPEWVAIPFSREFSWPRNRTQVSCIVGRLFTV